MAVIDKKNYQLVLDKIDVKKHEEIVQYLRSIPFMKVLSSKVVRDMHLFMEPVKYQVNQVVFQEGMKAEYVVFVRKGSFELSRCF